MRHCSEFRRLGAAIGVALGLGVPALYGGPASGATAPRWSLEAMLGTAHNFRSPLAIRQQGEPELEIDARYDTRAGEFPLYYAVRAARHDDGGAWALELLHHKLHLREPPPEVQSFAISHGYNLVTAQRLWRRRSMRAGIAAGAVIAHPENRVRGRPLDEGGGMFGSGYHLAGVTTGVLAGVHPTPSSRVSFVGEIRLTASHARVPVAGGNATVPNWALHVLAGAAFGI